MPMASRRRIHWLMPHSGHASTLRTLLGLTLMILPLAACQTLGKGISTRYLDTSCSAFEPITYSSLDTPETVAQIRGHNAAWDSLCPAK
jgi:hypothetical protein